MYRRITADGTEYHMRLLNAAIGWLRLSHFHKRIIVSSENQAVDMIFTTEMAGFQPV